MQALTAQPQFAPLGNTTTGGTTGTTAINSKELKAQGIVTTNAPTTFGGTTLSTTFPSNPRPLTFTAGTASTATTGPRNASSTTSTTTTVTTASTSAAPKPPTVVKGFFDVSYFGFALCRWGEPKERQDLCQRSVAAVINAKTEPTNVTLVITNRGLCLLNNQDVAFATMPAAEIACISRHENVKGKPKMISVLATNRYNKDSHKAFQCYMVQTNSTQSAARLYALLTKTLASAAQEASAAISTSTATATATAKRERTATRTSAPSSPASSPAAKRRVSYEERRQEALQLKEAHERAIAKSAHAAAAATTTSPARTTISTSPATQQQRPTSPAQRPSSPRRVNPTAPTTASAHVTTFDVRNTSTPQTQLGSIPAHILSSDLHNPASPPMSPNGSPLLARKDIKIGWE